MWAWIADFRNIIFIFSPEYCLAGPLPGCGCSCCSAACLGISCWKNRIITQCCTWQSMRVLPKEQQVLTEALSAVILVLWCRLGCWYFFLWHHVFYWHQSLLKFPFHACCCPPVLSDSLTDHWWLCPSGVALGLLVGDFQTHLRGLARHCFLSPMCSQSPWECFCVLGNLPLLPKCLLKKEGGLSLLLVWTLGQALWWKLTQ